MIKLDNTIIKSPKTNNFKIQRFNITKGGRTADGTMQLELVTKKRKFFFTYTVISGDDLQTILDIIDSDKIFFTIEYQDTTGITRTATVYRGAEVSQDQWVREGNGHWRNVTFNLIEQ